jgi:hypothetical protein
MEDRITVKIEDRDVSVLPQLMTPRTGGVD